MTLKSIEEAARHYGPGAARRKLELLEGLAVRRFAYASQVYRLHEVLCYLRAIPDNAAVLAAVEQMLVTFADREDLRTHRDDLASSGIAGTDIRFAFDATTARWLASRWPELLTIDWELVEEPAQLMDRIYLLALDAETPGLDNEKASPRQWLARMRGPDETDACFVAQRFGQLPWPPFLRDALYTELNLPLVLAPGPGTPTRTHARLPGGRVVMQTRALRGRPDLRREARRAPRRVRRLGPRAGEEILDLTRAAMATRARYLDAFSDADPNNVRLVDAGDGLEFAVIGVRPEGRMLLEAVDGWLMLRNRVPIGYVLASALLRSSEIAFNLFSTWRGGDAAWLYGRVIATARALYGSDTFTVDPYQLGHKNAEGLNSGAWWFYQKLGFRPRDPDVTALMEEELASIAADRSHRSSRATLRRLVKRPMFLSLGRVRDDVLGILPLQGIGIAATKYLADRFGSARERGERICAREAARFWGWKGAQTLTWRRWSPLLALLAERRKWTRAEKAGVVAVVRAKGGPRESDFVTALQKHPVLERALAELAHE